MNSVKLISVFHKGKFVCDLIKWIDTVWVVNWFLIVWTDPEMNTSERKNLIIFYEVYFRYWEFHTWVLAFIIITNYDNIDREIENNIYSTCAIIGKKDSFRIYVILLFSHYYFPWVNGIAYSVKYWIGFTSMIPAFTSVNYFKLGRIRQVHLYFVITSVWNWVSYIIALYWSAPNVGNGYSQGGRRKICNNGVAGRWDIRMKLMMIKIDICSIVLLL